MRDQTGLSLLGARGRAVYIKCANVQVIVYLKFEKEKIITNLKCENEQHVIYLKCENVKINAYLKFKNGQAIKLKCENVQFCGLPEVRERVGRCPCEPWPS